MIRFLAAVSLFLGFSRPGNASDLSISVSGGEVKLSWPQAGLQRHYLQKNSTAQFANENWLNIADPVAEAGEWRISEAADLPRCFYRLAEWEILFDGASLAAFRGYHRAGLPPASVWTITPEKELMSVAVSGGAAISNNDLVTLNSYQNFELRWEWKTSNNGNSGIVFRLTEPTSTNYSTQTGPEYQLLDDAHSALTGKRLMGAAYGLFAPGPKTLVPTGQWNSCRLIVRGTNVQHWLNGGKVLEYEMAGAAWQSAVATYSDGGLLPGFGQTANAPLALQHHGEQTWFRNIMIRRLHVP
ncbi:DUF1080 domain-containing protein [Luteolibacter arcticus]|uniref:DUF1080 domain-containing protein n=1 Tax=Luteolibacter arcticus TaxID=1581411 RepID=A0ABT3GN20_9BACT|nr:DUF1080 domain-containing protein [Luteolibacter arcticus]MCW1924906.1 DUF1080 domain-containing protein [Luteolibacter arcticus]